jgi:MYXO-CTERM domain-containing protein
VQPSGGISESNAFTFSPALSVATGATVTFTVNATIAGHSAMNASPPSIAYASTVPIRSGEDRGLPPLILALMLLGLGLFATSRDSRRRSILSALVLSMVLAASIVGCTGSSSSAPGAPSSTLSVTAASASGSDGATSGLPLDVAKIVRR